MRPPLEIIFAAVTLMVEGGSRKDDSVAGEDSPGLFPGLSSNTLGILIDMLRENVRPCVK